LGACAKKQLALSGLIQSILSRATKANGGLHYGSSFNRVSGSTDYEILVCVY